MHLRIGFLLLLLGSAVLQTLPTCTTDDISGDYTHCASLQSNRTLYYYYSPDCNAENAPPLPPPNEDLPCNIDCSPGEYLPLDSIECELCEPGSYSLGGGKRFHIWEDSFPSSGPIVFDTYCSHSTSLVPSDDFPNCTGWTLDGYSTSSGDLTGLDSVNSILEVSFYLIENGSVAFYYMCDVETEGDALAYVLDEEMPIPLPRTTEFSYYTIPNISPGTHKVRWIFYKNPQAGTGEDIARITDVEIFGISAADDINCTPCAPGYYQPNIGQSQCLKCAANTFAEDEGSATCLPCVNGYSYEGASSCLPFDNICTVEDAIAYFSNCTETSEGMRRTKYWEWQVPLFCNPEGVSLPEPQDNQPCAPCPPGSYDSDGVCIFCNNGQYRNGDSCAICGEGTVAIPAVYYTEWDSWTAVFSTYCYGPCSGDGWQLYHDFVRATLSSGVQNDILLTATVQVGYGGGFSYDWSINGTMHNSYFKVTLNGKVLSQAYSGSGSDYFEIPQGLHDIGFWAHGDGVDVSHIDISSLIIYGVEDGGVTECTPCPAGYYQASPGQQYCSACPFGSYNPNEGSTHCNLCETNTYSSRAGQSECVPCPDGAHSAPGAGYCQNPSCTFISSDAEYVYNLSPYAGVPQYVDNVEANNGHFLISYCGLLYENDSECEDSFICETYDNFNPYAPGRDYLDWAHSIGFEENDDPTTGFSLKYNGGETTGCNGGVNRTATVKFNCASDNEEFTILSYSPTESSDCNAIFVQNSVYGCPVCNSKDFDKVKGDCENGKRVVQYVKKENARCNGVVKDSTESCDNPLTDNGLIVITVVATLIGVLLLFVAIVTFVVISYQKRKVKYSHLSEDNELNTFVLEDDEEAELVQPDDDDDL